MQQMAPERPYRSHLRPACLPCRRRKSRCQTEAGADGCVTCRAHRTPCVFPDLPSRNRPCTKTASPSRLPRGGGRGDVSASTRARSTSARRGTARQGTSTTSSDAPRLPHMASTTALMTKANQQPSGHGLDMDLDDGSSMGLDASDSHHVNLHIVGPAVTNDSQVLADYLSCIPEAMRSTRMVVPDSAGRSKPVLFTMVQKRPLGVSVNRSPSAEKLEVIEKLLEPCAAATVDEYFARANDCLPLLDQASFRRQFDQDRHRISPALLCCLYASTLIYWRHSPTLSCHRCPDSRFVWNLANEALYSELHLSPGMSIIKAILLNIGGRPTTSLIGNGILLGSAVSMAHSLGLNHNPMSWKIPQSEKYLRMKIWWALLLHDRWISLAHGTPPHISRAHYNVPLPRLENLCQDNASDAHVKTASVFIALTSLTDVLDRHLQHVYNVRRQESWDTSNLELSLNNWVESLNGCTRLIIIRGSHLDIAGAANLRLAYLTTRLLLQRIELESDKQAFSSDEERLMNRYIRARRTCEDILLLMQELEAPQLGDFWLSVSAFALPATVNFLLRCALETETSPAGLAQSTSFRIAGDLIATLRMHQQKSAWDLADICLAQHAEVVDKVLGGVVELNWQAEGSSSGSHSSSGVQAETQEFVMPDASLIDQFFPSLWDPLQNTW
ncbi:hypothetical protein CDD81_7008 [Ophiocordyceps australis]|uniref:Zn(2)-C6 fungal-type domain-containing protein n=1 Tax=Ophiocordyceps australis TaxID=1399860 RepID=A0A2C5YFZ0_9HYPO|nr:hypothetical protein CDD81_7008 [Ophiocordyceps australis]